MAMLIQRNEAAVMACEKIASLLQQEVAMPNRETQQACYPAGVQTVLGAIASWVNHYREHAGLRDQFGQCDAREVANIAQDLNIPQAELREIASKGPDSANKLQQMLVALKVDPGALSKTDPCVMRDLQRLCVSCTNKQQCAHELDVGTAAAHFHEFCPNSYTLDALFKPNDQPQPSIQDHIRG
jgi:hypothetical protein